MSKKIGIKTIKGLDLELFKQARIVALIAGVNVGDWINEAIKKALGTK